MWPMKKVFLGLVLIVLLSGCAQKNIESQDKGSNKTEQKSAVEGVEEGVDEVARTGSVEKVSFKTEDGFAITGNFVHGSKKGVVLLHQFNLDKSSYDNLVKKLNDANFSVLAIDLRGHGESLDQNGVKRTHASFSEQDFRNMVKDVKGAKRFLAQQGSNLYAVVGASIGANTALNYSAQDPSVEKIVLLSPGMNYKGIDTEASARSVKARTLVVASNEDTYSYGSSKALKQTIANSEFMELRNAGHGTRMFSGTFLENDIVKWLSGQ